MMALGVKRARRCAHGRRDPPTALAVAVALGRLVEQATWLGIAIDLDPETEIRPPPGDAGATGSAQFGWLA